MAARTFASFALGKPAPSAAAGTRLAIASVSVFEYTVE